MVITAAVSLSALASAKSASFHVLMGIEKGCVAVAEGAGDIVVAGIHHPLEVGLVAGGMTAGAFGKFVTKQTYKACQGAVASVRETGGNISDYCSSTRDAMRERKAAKETKKREIQVARDALVTLRRNEHCASLASTLDTAPLLALVDSKDPSPGDLLRCMLSSAGHWALIEDPVGKQPMIVYKMNGKSYAPIPFKCTVNGQNSFSPFDNIECRFTMLDVQAEMACLSSTAPTICSISEYCKYTFTIGLPQADGSNRHIGAGFAMLSVEGTDEKGNPLVILVTCGHVAALCGASVSVRGAKEDWVKAGTVWTYPFDYENPADEVSVNDLSACIIPYHFLARLGIKPVDPTKDFSFDADGLVEITYLEPPTLERPHASIFTKRVGHIQESTIVAGLSTHDVWTGKGVSGIVVQEATPFKKIKALHLGACNGQNVSINAATLFQFAVEVGCAKNATYQAVFFPPIGEAGGRGRYHYDPTGKQVPRKGKRANRAFLAQQHNDYMNALNRARDEAAADEQYRQDMDDAIAQEDTLRYGSAQANEDAVGRRGAKTRQDAKGEEVYADAPSRANAGLNRRGQPSGIGQHHGWGESNPLPPEAPVVSAPHSALFASMEPLAAPPPTTLPSVDASFKAIREAMRYVKPNPPLPSVKTEEDAAFAKLYGPDASAAAIAYRNRPVVLSEYFEFALEHLDASEAPDRVIGSLKAGIAAIHCHVPCFLLKPIADALFSIPLLQLPELTDSDDEGTRSVTPESTLQWDADAVEFITGNPSRIKHEEPALERIDLRALYGDSAVPPKKEARVPEGAAMPSRAPEPAPRLVKVDVTDVESSASEAAPVKKKRVRKRPPKPPLEGSSSRNTEDPVVVTDPPQLPATKPTAPSRSFPAPVAISATPPTASSASRRSLHGVRIRPSTVVPDDFPRAAGSSTDPPPSEVFPTASAQPEALKPPGSSKTSTPAASQARVHLPTKLEPMERLRLLQRLKHADATSLPGLKQAHTAGSSTDSPEGTSVTVTSPLKPKVIPPGFENHPSLVSEINSYGYGIADTGGRAVYNDDWHLCDVKPVDRHDGRGASNVSRLSYGRLVDPITAHLIQQLAAPHIATNPVLDIHEDMSYGGLSLGMHVRCLIEEKKIQDNLREERQREMGVEERLIDNVLPPWKRYRHRFGDRGVHSDPIQDPDVAERPPEHMYRGRYWLNDCFEDPRHLAYTPFFDDLVEDPQESGDVYNSSSPSYDIKKRVELRHLEKRIQALLEGDSPNLEAAMLEIRPMSIEAFKHTHIWRSLMNDIEATGYRQVDNARPAFRKDPTTGELVQIQSIFDPSGREVFTPSGEVNCQARCSNTKDPTYDPGVSRGASLSPQFVAAFNAVASKHPDVGMPVSASSDYTLPPTGDTEGDAAFHSVRAQSSSVGRGDLSLVPEQHFKRAWNRYLRHAATTKVDQDFKQIFDDFVTSLDGTKSAGWSALIKHGPKQTWKDNKDALWSRVAHRMLARVVFRDILHLLTPTQMFEHGLSDPKVISPKKEGHSLKKSTTGRWRSIWVCSVVDLACEALSHYPLDKAQIREFQSGKVFCGAALGVGHDKRGMKLLTAAIDRVRADDPEGRVGSADASGWDMSVTRDDLLVAGDLRSTCTSAATPTHAAAIELALRLQAVVASAHCFVLGRVVFQCNYFAIVDSGRFSTSADNTIVRLFLAYVCGAIIAMSTGDDLIWAGLFNEALFAACGKVSRDVTFTDPATAPVQYNSHEFTLVSVTAAVEAAAASRATRASPISSPAVEAVSAESVWEFKRAKASFYKMLANLSLKSATKEKQSFMPSQDSIDGICNALLGTLYEPFFDDFAAAMSWPTPQRGTLCAPPQNWEDTW